ncbi:MAG: hypothetical protein KZQ89_16990 [Candidatus Thiodiazotropha sp. (ex Lucinoma kastoroae)]|nr:hypothetical protein [Candidatus Thiodiazotropha sp. (ex Lucinoma kastoroae)]
MRIEDEVDGFREVLEEENIGGALSDIIKLTVGIRECFGGTTQDILVKNDHVDRIDIKTIDMGEGKHVAFTSKPYVQKHEMSMTTCKVNQLNDAITKLEYEIYHTNKKFYFALQVNWRSDFKRSEIMYSLREIGDDHTRYMKSELFRRRIISPKNESFSISVMSSGASINIELHPYEPGDIPSC